MDLGQCADLRLELIATKAKDVHLANFVAHFQPLVQATCDIDDLQLRDQKVLVTDTLCVWLQRSAQICTLRPESVALFSVVTLDSANQLFHFVRDYWTDSGAALANSLRDLFTKLISLLKVVLPSEQFLSLLQSWTRTMLQYPRAQRVVFFTLEVLSKTVGGSYILAQDPKFTADSILLVDSNALANPVGKCVSSVYQSMSKHQPLEEWVELWAQPINQVLLTTQNNVLRDNLLTYVVSLLLRTEPKAFPHFVKWWCTDRTTTKTLILTRALKLGLTLGFQPEDYIGLDVLDALLRHRQFSLRLSALSLFASSPKTSMPIKAGVYDVIQKNMENLLLETDSGRRNEVLGLLRQFMFRVRACSYSAARSLKTQEKRACVKAGQAIVDAQAQLNTQQVELAHSFCDWLLTFIQLRLQPGVPYYGVCCAIKLLDMLVHSGVDQSVDSSVYDKQYTAPFPFEISLYSHTTVRLLIDNLTNKYEDIRQLSSQLLDLAPSPVSKYGSKMEVSSLTCRAKSLLTGLRGREGDGSARAVAFCYRLSLDISPSMGQSLLLSLLDDLEEKATHAQSDLSQAVQMHSIHGYYTALQLIAIEANKREMAAAFSPQIVSRILASIHTIWTCVRDILCHDSPEGNMPEELESNFNYELEKKYGPATQVVLSYSWRAIKEAAGLLQAMLQLLGLDKDTVSDIGELLVLQISSIRHRGAFSAVYPAFVTVCHTCQSTAGLERQPQIWLETSLDLIRVKSSHITRRSGGIPFLVSAILSTDDHQGTLVQSTFLRLLEIARQPAVREAGEKMDLPQVHAFNIIKVMVAESSLSRYASLLIDRSLELAITSFSDPVWSLRNCAVMLFTALQYRLFGSRNDTTALAKRFFAAHRTVRSLLLRNLESNVPLLSQASGEGTIIVESVYPVLSLLSRLQGIEGYDGLDAFRPLVLECLGSRLWKVREVAARTLARHLTANNRLEVVGRLLEGSTLLNQNALHGCLLAALEVHPMMSRCDISKIVTVIQSRFEMYAMHNSCPETRLAFVRVVKTYCPELDMLKCLADTVVSTSLADSPLSSSMRLVQQELALHYLTVEDKDEKKVLAICHLVKSRFFEVQMATVTHVASAYSQAKLAFTASQLSAVFTAFFSVLQSCTHAELKALLVQVLGFLWLYAGSKSAVWNYLYSDLSSQSQTAQEEVSNASLQALGFYVSAPNTQRWLDLVDTSAGQNAPYSQRRAALQSVINYAHANDKTDFPSGVYKHLFLFLSDDESDIRELASKAVSKLLVLDETTEACNEQRLLDFLAHKPDGQQYLCALLQSGDGLPESLSAQLIEAQEEESILFTVEKQNLFRDELRTLDMLAARVGAVDEQWLSAGVPTLMHMLDRMPQDDALGWTSSPQMYLVLRRVALALRLSSADWVHIRAKLEGKNVHSLVLHEIF